MAILSHELSIPRQPGNHQSENTKLFLKLFLRKRSRHRINARVLIVHAAWSVPIYKNLYGLPVLLHLSVAVYASAGSNLSGSKQQ